VNIPHDDFHRTLLDSNRKKEKVEEMKLNLSSIYQKVSLRLVSMMGRHRESNIQTCYAPCVWKNSLFQICKLNICAFQRKAPFD
jgi:hypothetical protein